MVETEKQEALHSYRKYKADQPPATGAAHEIIFIVLVLPAPFGPRKPKHSPPPDGKVDAVDRHQVAVAPGQLPRGYDGKQVHVVYRPRAGLLS